MTAISANATMSLAKPRLRRGNLARYILAMEWLTVLAVFVAYFCADRENRFAGAFAGVLVFTFVWYSLPACRPVFNAFLCPWNWALMLFFLQLIVLPLSILLQGPSIGVLPDLPSHFAINMAMVLNAGAFLVTAFTYQWLAGRHRRRRRESPRELKHGKAVAPAPSNRFIWIYLALGVLGLFLAFHDLGGLVNYYEDPAANVERIAATAHTLPGLMSLLLRPFLGFALVVLWCRWLDRNQRHEPRRAVLVTVAFVIAVVVSYSTFGYNRGSFVVPLIAMIATLMARARWVSFGAVVSTGAILAAVLIVAPFWAVYRNSNLTAADLVDDAAAANSLGDNIDLLQTLQMYGSGPQYLGFLLEKSHWGSTPYLGSTLIPSVVEPLPVLGGIFRSRSGPYIYNELIYGNPTILDQILPFSSEMFLNFGVFGIIAASCLFAVLAFRLQMGFEHAKNSLETYLWQYSAIWLLFLIMGSISVITQILFYFFWPVYGHLRWNRAV